jgi:hypothetical protein
VGDTGAVGTITEQNFITPHIILTYHSEFQ